MKRMLSVISIAFIVSIFQVSAIVAEELVLMNGTLIDGTGDNPISNAAIVVRDNRILAVGPYDAGRGCKPGLTHARTFLNQLQNLTCI